MERQKCSQQVVHTLTHVCRASHQIEAHLIADGPDRAACEELVGQAGLSDRIQFHGRVTPEQVQPLPQRSQLILLRSDLEGLPVPLLEAMAAGVVPVVRAIESGVPELVQHEITGLLVVIDPAEAAAALVRLSLEPDLWQGCSTQSRALDEACFGADQCFELWLGLIEQKRALHARAPRPALQIFAAFCRWLSRVFRANTFHPRRLLWGLQLGADQVYFYLHRYPSSDSQ